MDGGDLKKQGKVIDGLCAEVKHGRRLQGILFGDLCDISEAIRLKTLYQVRGQVSLVKFGASETSVEWADLESALVCLGDHLPELLELLWLQGILEINQAVNMAWDFEIEYIKGSFHGHLHFERVGWRILSIEVFLIDGALQEFDHLTE